MFSLLVLSFAAIFGVVCGREKIEIVGTKYGRVEGSLDNNGRYYKFLSIRYGIPVKFRAPEEPPSHQGVYKANNKAVICPQFPYNDPLAVPSENEDCLILNIYTPSVHNSSLPVIVFLHGGGFGVGASSPSFYGPQYLVSQKVVVVTVNYRLNAYGFLNLGIKEAPGNAGLKDIRASLRYIKQNIRNFGGDPDNVTVFGQGSGGIAAIYLTLSESTKGLFHRIISQSGSVFSTHSHDINPLNTASHVAKTLGHKTTDPYELLKIYSDTPIAVVEEAISKQMNAKSVFLPSVEEVFDDEEPFLIETPYNIIANNHKSFHPVPAILGLNTVEGLTSTLDYNTISSQINRIKHEDYSALDQKNLDVPVEELDGFRKILKDTYFANTTTDEAVVGGIINLNTDFNYVGPMYLFSELYTNNTGVDIYEYIFNYLGNRNFGRILTNSSLAATANMDELYYLFELERLSLPMDENDARMITFMTSMWTNFAKFGSPTPDPVNGEWLTYPHQLAISLEPEYVAPLTPDRAHFWFSVYYKYGADVRKGGKFDR